MLNLCKEESVYCSIDLNSSSMSKMNVFFISNSMVYLKLGFICCYQYCTLGLNFTGKLFHKNRKLTFAPKFLLLTKVFNVKMLWNLKGVWVYSICWCIPLPIYCLRNGAFTNHIATSIYNHRYFGIFWFQSWAEQQIIFLQGYCKQISHN